MRGIIAINLALCLSTTTALPYIQVRSDAPKKPQYSVVPLEPGSGGSPPGGGGGGNNPAGDKTVTVIQTVVQTPAVQTKYITVTPDAQTVTKAVPTTVVSTVVQGSGASVKTITVVSTETLASPATSTPAGSSVIADSSSSNAVSAPTIGQNSTMAVHTPSTSLHTTAVRGTQVTPLTTTATPVPTSSRTYDNGMWHTTYPPWNATAATGRYRI
ncbi:hypothetical protein VHEMI03930 [[Torrubiella] hemipterigena]|uniref:Uncharacterized protein n=1 Tax=[Torrubiella] hemipterigena TaxID=1531966 RepID=A0A0A1STW7_9HYPO|nr:hypothetical protein VHEMI03930 [[Torrubiella] hemipterigena]